MGQTSVIRIEADHIGNYPLFRHQLEDLFNEIAMGIQPEPDLCHFAYQHESWKATWWIYQYQWHLRCTYGACAHLGSNQWGDGIAIGILSQTISSWLCCLSESGAGSSLLKLFLHIFSFGGASKGYVIEITQFLQPKESGDLRWGGCVSGGTRMAVVVEEKVRSSGFLMSD